ncbi:MAG: hypothetical protein HY291_00535 [Planctomycetes bacterium]|nr:hypothetical protein [Planctomycetota bacterium]
MIKQIQMGLVALVLLGCAVSTHAAEELAPDAKTAAEIKPGEKDPAVVKLEEEAKQPWRDRMMEEAHRGHIAAANRKCLFGLGALAAAAVLFFWLIKSRWARVAIVVASLGTACLWVSYWSSLVF